jgi:16S rRNA (adenine1518-N6/adenine1519-N6)-dimethyltransferase
VRARKRFGQHFLEAPWVEKVVRAIDPQADETFVEIGPGRGALTRPLAARAKQVFAYEIDRDLAAGLRAEAIPNVTVVEGDVLETLTVRPPGPQPLRVAGNLPYNAASPIMFRLSDLFAAGAPIGDATLMLQREVADRLVAAPGTREYGVLSVLLQHVATIDIILKLPAGAFRPPPKVLSALVRLRFHRRCRRWRACRPSPASSGLFSRAAARPSRTRCLRSIQQGDGRSARPWNRPASTAGEDRRP